MVVKPIIYLFYECVSIYNEIAWWSNSYQIHITSFFNEILSFFPFPFNPHHLLFVSFTDVGHLSQNINTSMNFICFLNIMTLS